MLHSDTTLRHRLQTTGWRWLALTLLLLVPLVVRGVAPIARAADETPLQTAGALAPLPSTSTGNDLRSRLGSLLAGSDSAWRGLTRDERAVLLNGVVEWEPYVDLTASDDELAAALDPVAFAALDVAPDAEIDDWQINAVLLDLPVTTLERALAASEPVAVAQGDDILLITDFVVVGAVFDAAGDAPDLPAATVDARGLLVLASGETAGATATRPASTTGSAPTATSTASSARRSENGRSIPVITLADLPPEAIDTLDLIARGGPFPYRQDGAVFGNFEGNLPAAPDGFYREYTVITPWEDDRGARRIVTGDNDRIVYYTDDHYDSFAEVRLDD